MSGDDASTDVESYQLSADDNERVFLRDIIPSELEPVSPQEQPVAVFLIGQPGAGKSATADEIRDVFGDSGFVEVDSDIYKAYHPRYAEILRMDDKLMAAAICQRRAGSDPVATGRILIMVATRGRFGA